MASYIDFNLFVSFHQTIIMFLITLLNRFDSRILRHTALSHFHHNFHLTTKFAPFFLQGRNIKNCLPYQLNIFYNLFFLSNENIHYLDKSSCDFFFRYMRSFTFWIYDWGCKWPCDTCHWGTTTRIINHTLFSKWLFFIPLNTF